jgi:hypothetical protein
MQARTGSVEAVGIAELQSREPAGHNRLDAKQKTDRSRTRHKATSTMRSATREVPTATNNKA